MLRTLFTSSFKKIPIAFVVAIVVIGCIEYAGHKKLPSSRFFSHEVDHLLNKIEKYRGNNAEYVLIGDSVGLQLCRQFRKDLRFANLATNQAVEITGQYFIVRRYLEYNRKPRAVILLSLPQYSQNLEQIYTENFVYRPFNRLFELIEIGRVKLDPAIFAKMLSYKLLPSFKYRLKLQEEIVGFTNSDVYSGVDVGTQASREENHSLLKIIRDGLNRRVSSEVHFREFVDYLSRENIKLYYVPVPLKDTAESKSYQTTHNKMIAKRFLPIKEQYPQTFYYESGLVFHDPDFFRDPVHYNESGLPNGEKYAREKIALIMEQHD